MAGAHARRPRPVHAPAGGAAHVQPQTEHDVADLSLADQGMAQIAWAGQQMPVLESIRRRFAAERPLRDMVVAACLHVTAETANLLLTLSDGGARVALCSANPLSVQDDVAAALAVGHQLGVRAWRGEGPEDQERRLVQTLEQGPHITIDDGADLLVAAHQSGMGLGQLIGGTEETTTGLVRLRRLEQAGTLRCPVLAVNEARTERALNDRHGTGQSALDGIIRASHVLLAGHTVVVIGYGWAGQGIAERARGAGAHVVVCEIDPLRALEARMAGYEVLPALEAAERGDVFITVTGSRRVLRGEHFSRMKDGALLVNAGHFDVEIDLDELAEVGSAGVRQVRPLVEQFERADGARLNLLVRGRVVNLAAAEGHPPALMDVSFSLQALCVEELVRRGGELAPRVHGVPPWIDEEVARLKLAALGVQFDHPTSEQEAYRQAWT
ncbi:MAG TPA: adenosylhomocysteinase [Solirubrobacteraceae bacterium]|nr:adenosylhomocysteinase [Solirubrobacteraceae bacterium]